jgi:hypothetical protein
VNGQADCSQSLIEAERAYYTGRLSGVPEILSACLSEGFSKEQRVEAYKLIALSSMFSRDYKSADSSLVLLLKLSPEFEPGPQDPPELQKRLEKIGVRPSIGFAVNAGTYMPIIKLTEVYNLRDTPSDVKYQSSLGWQAGISASYHFTKHWMIESGFEWQSFALKITNEDDLVETRMEETQGRRQITLASGYSHKWKGITGQFLVGVALHKLISANSSLYRLERVSLTSDEIIYREQLDFSNLDHRLDHEFRPFALVRLAPTTKSRFKFSLFMRYELGLSNQTESRYFEGIGFSGVQQGLAFDWIEDDFRISFFSIGISLTKQFHRVRP